MDITKKLYLEIDEELEHLAGLTPGSEDHKAVSDNVGKLFDRAIEIYKIDRTAEENAEVRKSELELKQQQLAEEKRNHLIGYCLTAAGIIVPTLLTIWGTNKSIKFEETGTITTTMGRGFIQRLLPKK